MTVPACYTDPRAWSITGEPLPGYVWDIVRANYIEPLRRIAERSGVVLVPSIAPGALGGSCYRSPEYERRKGRAGTSLHCFPAGSLGACDLVMMGGGVITPAALDALRRWSPFARVCHYPANGFAHVDYTGPGVTRLGRGWYTCASPAAAWRYVGPLVR
jgi:hypothetical protein